jgi:hypothetical protein
MVCTQSTPDFSVAEHYVLRNTTWLYSKDVASGDPPASDQPHLQASNHIFREVIPHLQEGHRVFRWVMPHLQMSHATSSGEPNHIFGWATHLQSAIPHLEASNHIFRWAMPHLQVSHHKGGPPHIHEMKWKEWNEKYLFPTFTTRITTIYYNNNTVWWKWSGWSVGPKILALILNREHISTL